MYERILSQHTVHDHNLSIQLNKTNLKFVKCHSYVTIKLPVNKLHTVVWKFFDRNILLIKKFKVKYFR